MIITKFEEPNTYKHFHEEKLKGYIYEDLLDDYFFNNLKKFIENIFSKGDTKTFKTHGTIFNFEGNRYRTIANKQNSRYQHVMFDLSFNKEWYSQTKETITDWASKKISDEVSPYFVKYISIIKSLPPYNVEPASWIPIRLHLNVCKPNEGLGLHTDGIPTLKRNFSRFHSLTFYLYDHIENTGGEFWSINGFVYKPKKNSAILLENGSRVMHGVTFNQHPEGKIRLAFTLRIAHKDDLILYDSPDKHLYKIDYYDDN